MILSDGDAAFQPRKVERSGLWRAFADNVLIYVHKEQSLDCVERLYPARHYVMVDDKLWILAAMKQAWGTRVTTVFVRQGHYALDPGVEARYPRPDITLDRIGDLLDYPRAAFGGYGGQERNSASPALGAGLSIEDRFTAESRRRICDAGEDRCCGTALTLGRFAPRPLPRSSGRGAPARAMSTSILGKPTWA